jgi:hypothetical protein
VDSRLPSTAEQGLRGFPFPVSSMQLATDLALLVSTSLCERKEVKKWKPMSTVDSPLSLTLTHSL